MLSCPGCISMVTAGWDVLTPTQNTKTVSHKHSRVRSSWQRRSAQSLIFPAQLQGKNMCRTRAGTRRQCYLERATLSVRRRRGQTRRRPRRPSPAAWAAGEETGCWSGQEGSRRCCKLLVWGKWSAAGLEMEICCRKRRGQWVISSNMISSGWGNRSTSMMTNVNIKQCFQIDPTCELLRLVYLASSANALSLELKLEIGLSNYR